MLIILLSGCFSPAAADGDAANRNLYQVDPNGDGTLNIFDLLDLLKAVNGINNADISADFDNNGAVNIFDLLSLLKLISMKPVSDSALVITRVLAEDTAAAPSAVQLATSLVTTPVMGILRNDSTEAEYTVYEHLLFEKGCCFDGGTCWENVTTVEGGHPLIILAYKYIDDRGIYYAANSGVSGVFPAKGGEVYLVKLNIFENASQPSPWITITDSSEVYLEWEPLPATAGPYYISQSTDSTNYLNFHRLVYEHSVRLVFNDEEAVYINIIRGVGIYRRSLNGQAASFVYYTKTNVLEPF
jgi:hypothetical protein